MHQIFRVLECLCYKNWVPSLGLSSSLLSYLKKNAYKLGVEKTLRCKKKGIRAIKCQLLNFAVPVVELVLYFYLACLYCLSKVHLSQRVIFFEVLKNLSMIMVVRLKQSSWEVMKPLTPRGKSIKHLIKSITTIVSSLD
jgi:hypothetical protein